MSIINVHIEPNYALVGVDTAGTVFESNGKPRGADLQKAIILGDVLVGGRGNLSLYAFLASSLMSQPERWSVDTLMSRLEEQCYRALHGYENFMQSAHPGHQVPAAAAGLEVTIVGWSDRFDTMLGAVAALQPDGSFIVDRIEHACAAPGVWNASDIPDMSSPDSMASAMQCQVEAFKDADPDAPIGGHAVFYLLTPTEIRQLAPISLCERLTATDAGPNIQG